MSSAGSGKVFRLQDNQRDAANPRDNVWLSASAGTGKTQVLSARVLRLLLMPEVQPSQILCLTFTKAGAAEMANRINAVLARWVRLDAGTLGKELDHLGADFGPETQARARTLFASVLDCPGGGLRIDTIHAFSQWLLGNFPAEAGLTPGARPIEDRERELLAREVLAELLGEAEAAQDDRLLGAVNRFILRKDPQALRGWLLRCADHPDLWAGPGAWQPPMAARMRGLLGMPADADRDWAAQALDPAMFPDAQLIACRQALKEWGKPTGNTAMAGIDRWLTLSATERCEALTCLLGKLLNAEGLPNGHLRFAAKFDERFCGHQAEVGEAIGLYRERCALLDLADHLTDALELGRAFALRWEEAKRREGLLDFGDLIRMAARLLGENTASDWIRYKLDRTFDHILIDEAQDTNQEQWDIVEALIDDFFAGDGAGGERLRTIFTVGDYKQAIFGFQGTSPENYERAKLRIHQRIMDAREFAHGLRDNRLIPEWRDLDLGRSFRTSRPVLDFVNAAIAALGYEAFGLPKAPAPHKGEDLPGLVTLWEPVRAESAEEPEQQDGESEDDGGDAARDWLPRHDTVLAQKIAQQVARWVKGAEPLVLAKGEPRHAGAGDIMVLVRKRRELAAQIVAQLHARGVPVAGVDRLRLGAPLAVRDLLAALRFAAQPLDDLSLANLLASPLIGWSQDELLAHVPRDKDVPLWEHLRGSSDAGVQATAERLKALLARADYLTPQALLAWLLTGPWQGRARLVARLGREANDPIDELVNAAFAYESAAVPSLAGFIEWFDAGTGELKRDADAAGGQVRVLTVHGSKGLQAPIVILADATGRPGEGSNLELIDDPLGIAQEAEKRRTVPLPGLAKAERVGPVSGAEERAAIADMQEHWRLLYVAMTRAEEALFIGGSLGAKDKQGPHEDSWYARLAPLFERDAVNDPIWGARREWGERAASVSAEAAVEAARVRAELPDWARLPIGPEPRPPRPLAPSAAGEERGADPPLPPDHARAAARRGVLTHRLLERLPDLPPEARAEAGAAWLARNGSEIDPGERADMLHRALAVIDHPEFRPLFSPAALAEVPLAANVAGIVVAGMIDRLLIEGERITLVDFKTARRPPARAEDIPAATLAQLAAYVAALEVIHPGRAIRAGVLYTQTPQLFELAPETLAPHKQRLGAAQESYAPLNPDAY